MATTTVSQNLLTSVPRLCLTANSAYYVTTGGNDSTGNGSSGSPWLTIQHAINYVQQYIDLAGFTLTINVADGTYTGTVIVSSPFTGGGVVQITGNTSTPANCIVSVTSGNCFYVGNNASLSVAGFKTVTTTSGHHLVSELGGVLNVNGAWNFGAGANYQIVTLKQSAINISSNYTISGGAQYHIVSFQHSLFYAVSVTITLTGTPAFSGYYLACEMASSCVINGNTYSGSATGKSYSVATNGVIYSGVTLPGNGTTSVVTGGQYV